MAKIYDWNTYILILALLLNKYVVLNIQVRQTMA